MSVELWDVFHSDRLEVEKGLTLAQVRAKVARGALRDDDLARPAGSGTPWVPLAELPTLLEPPAPASEPPSDVPPALVPSATVPDDPETDVSFIFEKDDSVEALPVTSAFEEPSAPPPASMALEFVDDDRTAFSPEEPSVSYEFTEPPTNFPVPELFGGEPDLALIDDDDEESDDEEDDGDGDFSLARSSTEHVEELDLAAMVDVAFQLVLFFLVTASTILYKSLEVPKPNDDPPPDAVAQGRPKTLDELEREFIVVQIDPAGAIQIDHEPVAPELNAMARKLRDARQETGRTVMLVLADVTTRHRSVVLAYDAANEVGLRVGIGAPTGSGP